MNVRDWEEMRALNEMRQEETKNVESLLAPLRSEMDVLNQKLLILLERRHHLSAEIGAVKKANGLPVHQAGREEEILKAMCAQSQYPEQTEWIFRTLFQASCAIQEKGQDPDSWQE